MNDGTPTERGSRGNATEFKPTMDPHALDIRREDKRVGSLQWHEGKPPRVVLSTDGPLLELPVDLLEDIVKKSHEQSPKNPKPITVAYSGGEMELRVGQEFVMREGDKWKIEGATGLGIYSPSGLGGTPTIRCSYVGGEPIPERDREWVIGNTINFCGDSIAEAISIQQKREAAQKSPTS